MQPSPEACCSSRRWLHPSRPMADTFSLKVSLKNRRFGALRRCVCSLDSFIPRLEVPPATALLRLREHCAAASMSTDRNRPTV